VTFIFVGVGPGLVRAAPPELPRAQPSSTSSESFSRASRVSGESSRDLEWYGYQTIATDLLGVAIVVVAGAHAHSARRTENVDYIAALLGVGTVFFGAPIVHAAHGNFDKAGYSLGLRLGAPAVIGGAAAGLVCLGACRDGLETIAVFVVLGGGVAALSFVVGVVLDHALLAWEPSDDLKPFVAVTEDSTPIAGLTVRF